MKQILILSFYYPPDLSAGSFRTSALVEALSPLASVNDIKIDIITTHPNRYNNYRINALNQETINNITIHRIKIPSHQSGFLDQAKAYTHYFSNCFKIAKFKKYDLVYATSGRLFSAFLGARIASQKHIPLFLDIRDIFTDTMESILKFPLNIFLPAFKLIELYTIKKASVLNLVSPGFLSYFKVNKQCKILTISNGVDACFHNVDYTNCNANRAIKRIVYAGNLGKGQALEKIIPALAEATTGECEFYIIGGGGQQQQLSDACCHLKNVRIFSPVIRDELIQHYRDADILFLHLDNLPAFSKVLPSKIFEYAVTGKPILAGVAGYSANFLSENVPGSWLFSPCDTAQAIAQLKSILKNNCEVKNRDAFYEKFNRKKLMNELAQQIISII